MPSSSNCRDGRYSGVHRRTRSKKERRGVAEGGVRDSNGKGRGIVNDASISWVDIVPTILDFAGVEEPDYEQPIMPAPRVDLSGYLGTTRRGIGVTDT